MPGVRPSRPEQVAAQTSENAPLLKRKNANIVSELSPALHETMFATRALNERSGTNHTMTRFPQDLRPPKPFPRSRHSSRDHSAPIPTRETAANIAGRDH